MVRFEDEIQPILIDYCYRCHGDGCKKGNVALDQFASGEAMLATASCGGRCSRTCAPASCRRRQAAPVEKEVGLLADWIKRDVFGADPHDPDPGRVTIRRLNRVEYRNTVRDLTGFDFKAEEEFPPDDTGYGFDTIGDVLSVSPLLLEKYMQAAESIVAAAVPTVSRTHCRADLSRQRVPQSAGGGNGDRLSFYKKAKLSRLYTADADGDYRFTSIWPWTVRRRPTRGNARSSSSSMIASSCARPLRWQDHKSFPLYLPRAPLGRRPSAQLGDRAPDSAREKEERARSPDRFGEGARAARSAKMDPPAKLRSVLPQGRASPDDRRAPAVCREILGQFATRAFRRPVDDRTLDRLVNVAAGIYSQPGTASSRAWRGPWSPFWRRLALSFASKPRADSEPNDRQIPRRRSNTRWPRDSRISSGRRCPTTS